jgi:O-antigen/teichoic acid export membrane protein
MNLSFTDLLKNIVIYGTSELFIKVGIFITLPIYTRIFGPEEYGVLSYVLSAVGLLGVIISFGADTTYARFYFDVESLKEKRLVTSTWFGFLLLWSVAFTVMCLPFLQFISKWSFGTSDYGLLFLCALLTVPLSLINNLCGQVLRNQDRSSLFAWLNIISSLLNIGLGLFAVVILHMGLIGILGGSLLAGCIILPIRLWTVRSLFRPVFSRQMLLRMLAFGLPLVPMAMAYWIFGMSDRLLLGKLSTLEQLGVYAVATSATGILALINAAFGQAWAPLALRTYAEQREIAPALFGQMMTYILAGFGVLAVSLTTFALEILMILSTPSFYAAAIAVGPLSLGMIAAASTQVTALAISLTKQTKYFGMFSWSAALLNLALNVFLIPRWGMIAACWSTTISYSFLTVSYMIVSQKLWPVAYEKRRVLPAIGITISFIIAAPFLPEMPHLPRVMMKIAYCTTYIGFLFLFRVLDKREWLKLSSIFRRRLAPA